MRKYALALMVTLGMKQGLAQQVNFAEPVLDPFNIYHNFYFDSLYGNYNVQIYEQFIDIDNDEDLDLMFFDLNAIEENFYDRQKFYCQKNTINENGKFGDTIKIEIDNYSKGRIFHYEDHSLVDLDKDGDLDLYGKGSSIGYSSYDHLVLYENNSSLIVEFELGDISPDLDENIGGCDGTYSGCYAAFTMGDLDNDMLIDIVTSYQYVYDYLDGSDTAYFMFFKNNGSSTLNPMEDRIYNPFNLESVISKFVGDSLFIYDLYIGDLNGDEYNDLVLSYLSRNDTSKIWYLEVFYADNLTGNFDGGRSQLITEDDFSGINRNSSNNFLFVDIDADGDVDIYKDTRFSQYLVSDTLYINNQLDTLYFIENLSPTTDIVNQEKLEYQLFPNPVIDQALLTFSNKKYEKATFELFNAYGQLVQLTTTNEEQIVIDAKEQSPGFYTFRITLGNEYTSGKLIID
ncbi:MAG: T9SS type A sorting domain-containing protein [Chitinophagales bacterium]